MEIQTVHGSLVIIKRVFSNSTFEINVCKYENGDEKLYTVIALKEPEVIHNNIKKFFSLRSNDKFVDFVEFFSRDSFLYISFLYYEEFPMNFQEVSQLPLLQRVAIVKQILSLIIILDMPKSILYDVLSNNNINLDPSGKVYFNYFLRNIDRYNDIKNKDAVKKIGIILIEIFNYELSTNSVEGLNKIISNCDNGIYTDLMVLYSDYAALYENFVKSLQVVKEKEISRFRKILNKILWIFNKVTPVLIMLALSVGVIYLVITLTEKDKAKEPTKIKTIGTVQID